MSEFLEAMYEAAKDLHEVGGIRHYIDFFSFSKDTIYGLNAGHENPID